MDLLVLISVAVALIVVILTILYLQKNKGDEKKENVAARPRPQQAQPGIPRRAQIARNQRNRLARANVDQVPEQAAAADSDDDGDEPEIMKADIAGEKMGAKKRAKLEAKAEKKSQREAEMKLREEKKKKEAMQEDERKKEEEKERLEELKREEAARKEKEEQERREHEEYLKMKAAFVVEEEGFEEGDEDEKANLLQEFIKYIQENKVVILEDLATHFKLKTQVAIDRIHDLQRNGTLTGVIDDRGKYICISEDELSAIAKFIKQRGRISLSELAENSNSLINFAQPVV